LSQWAFHLTTELAAASRLRPVGGRSACRWSGQPPDGSTVARPVRPWYRPTWFPSPWQT